MPGSFKKTPENTQFARTSTAAGNRTALPAPWGPDFGIEPLADQEGRLIVRIAGGGGFIPVPPDLPTIVQRYTTGAIPAAYEPVPLLAPQITAAVPANRLYISKIFGFSDSLINTYLQVFDLAGVPAPGQSPLISYPMGLGPNARIPEDAFTFDLYPLFINNDLSLVLSTTHFTYTPIAAAALWVGVVYIEAP